VLASMNVPRRILSRRQFHPGVRRVEQAQEDTPSSSALSSSMVLVFVKAPSRIAATAARVTRLKRPKPKLKACQARAPTMPADDLLLLLRRAWEDGGGGGMVVECRSRRRVRLVSGEFKVQDSGEAAV
jgi:hypothetical protein